MKEIIVKHARLHQTIEVLGAGQVGPTLNKRTIPSLQMKLLPMGLLIEMNNNAGKKCEATIIPLPNIAAMQLDGDPTEVEEKRGPGRPKAHVE